MDQAFVAWIFCLGIGSETAIGLYVDTRILHRSFTTIFIDACLVPIRRRTA